MCVWNSVCCHKGENRLIIEDYAFTVLRPLCGVSQKYPGLHILDLPLLSGERAGISVYVGDLFWLASERCGKNLLGWGRQTAV
jgi:hypothetical protein